MPHIGPAGWLALQDQSHPIVDAVNFRTRFHACKCVPEISVIVCKGLGGLGYLIGVVSRTGANGHERLEFVVLAKVIAFKLDARHHEALPLRHVDRDANVFFVGRNRDLG